MRLHVWLFVATSASLSLAQEQRKDTVEYQYPAEIVVTAPRISIPLREIPFSASVVSRSTMRELPRSISIDEPLKLVPGVKVDNQSNGERVHLSIRGQGILTERGIRGIRILYDGIPLNDPTGFAPDIFDVDFNGVDRIEVLRGAAASLYGGSASGGIVNIVSRISPAVPLIGEADATFGSNNFWKGYGEVGGSLNTLNYRLSLSKVMGDGYREHTHFWGENVYGKATYTPTASFSITPVIGLTNVYHENPEGITLEQYIDDPKQPNSDAIPFNEFLQAKRFTAGATGVLVLSEKHELQFGGYVKHTDFTEANNGTFNYRTLTTPGLSIQYTGRQGASENYLRNTFSAGVDLQWQTIDEHRVDNLLSVPGDTVRSREQISQRGVGIFLLDKIALGPQWVIMASLRYDYIRNQLEDLLKNPFDLSGDARFEKTTVRLGVSFAATEAIDLFANWGEGFLPPATEELAQNPDNFGGFNRHLVSATSSGIDVGVRGSPLKDLFYDVTGFYLSTENDFDRYRIADPLRNQETFYRNAGSSRRFGVELYGRYAPLEAAEIQVAYTYSDFTYTNSTPLQVVMDDPAILKYVGNGNRLPNAPQHQLVFDGIIRVVPGFTIGLTTEMLGKTYIDGANVEAEAAPGYTLLHARARYEWSLQGVQVEATIQGRNLGNRSYVAFTEPDPGGNAYQPGAGREFFVGLKILL
jgi:iron complex outermembrane recepter protein